MRRDITMTGDGRMTAFAMTIDGADVAGGEWFEVLNPANGRVYDRAPACSRAELDRAMAAAARALPGWQVDEQARRAAMRRIADRLLSAKDELAAVLTAEQGKPLASAVGEVHIAADWFRYYADLEMPLVPVLADAVRGVEAVRVPLGVIAAITPWNVPLALASWKLAPALVAGNSLVLKPSPYTPLSTLRMGSLIASELPPGVLNVVSGGNELGSWMTSHPTPRKITFTGSIGTGKAVALAAASDLKRVTLELGGNDPAILLDDVDVAAIAGPLFWRAFANNGQICAAVKRVYVPERLYDDVVEAMAAVARSVVVGDGAVAGSQLGPINNRPQRDRVRDLVDDAVAHGARVAAGGRTIEGEGFFFQPTILASLGDGVRIVDEEQFGPALPIISYRDVDDAVARANHSRFGLSGSVWGTDVEHAGAVADRLECGTTWVNDHLTLAPAQPFGGHKWSGIGLENGPQGLLECTQMQVRSRPRK
jgi:acyl-CoA reductase-like NAD-dependent aldehyde dehydrogenase